MHPEGDFELLDGVIYNVAPEGTEHKLTRLQIETYLHQVVDLTRYTVGSEASFPAPGWKEGPKPDNYVARGALGTYADNHKEPAASDMLLVVEITNARSVETDKELQRKLQTYARVSIPDYWLIDLVSASVLVHRDPTGDTTEPMFRSIQRYDRDETIEALAVDELSVNCTFLLKLAQKH
jgi:Uma2 family endonuclease